MKTGLVLFRNDLRIHDNETLVRAIEFSDALIPLYVLPKVETHTLIPYSRRSNFRIKFLLESLADLNDSLKRMGSKLILRTGNIEHIVPELCLEYSVDMVFFANLACTEEVEQEKNLIHILSKIGISHRSYHTSTLVHPSDLPFPVEHLPEVFTEFRKMVEKKNPLAFSLPKKGRAPSLPSGLESESLPLDLITLANSVKIHPSRAIDWKGGEQEGIKRLTEYLWLTDCIQTYKETRNQMLGKNYSSKFSAYLSLGCLSARLIYQQIKAYEEERIANESTYWLVFELLWRDYFFFIASKHGRNLFMKSGIQKKITKSSTNKYSDSEKSKVDLGTFEKWRLGETEDEFVNSNMKELLLTGYMSNRGRQNVASFLVHNLELDWRLGAEWFETMLIDYDPASNYGNWNYIAGIGNDPRSRVFNTEKQAKDYDPLGEYRRTWSE